MESPKKARKRSRKQAQRNQVSRVVQSGLHRPRRVQNDQPRSVDRGRRAPKPDPYPQSEYDYEENYIYTDGVYDDAYYDDYYGTDFEGPNRGDQSLVSPEVTPAPRPPPTTTVPSYTEEVTYPCADYKPGDDDLQSFDFIRKFELDVNLDGYPGVARVRGSNRMQTAYRIDSTANLVMPTLRVFNQGLPEQFSFVTTFRNRRPTSNRWQLIRITNTACQPQFAVGLNPSRNAIQFSILNYNGELQTLSWEKPEVFDNEWHKLHFGVFRDKVVLYVNCEPVGEEPLQLVDSRIDLNGNIMISKEADSPRTQAIDLQWMVMACDPESVEREQCDELPERDKPAERPQCEVTCPQGPPGRNGTRGPLGRPGAAGERGPNGRIG